MLQARTVDRKIDSVSALKELRLEEKRVDSWQQQWRAAQPGAGEEPEPHTEEDVAKSERHWGGKRKRTRVDTV